MTKRNCLITLILFFIGIIAIFMVPLFTWGFVNDDFIFLHYCIKTPWANMLSFFYHGSPSNMGVSANAPMPKLSFLVALYRPLLSLIIKIQASFFGLNAYSYKLMGLVIHASLSTIILRILLSYFSFTVALISALFFAFHPSLFTWLGVLACQTYAFDLVFLIVIAWALKRFFDTNNAWFYFAACLCAFLSMLARETLLFLPAWIFIFTAYNNHNSPIIKAVKITSGFVISHITYFALKLYLFPFNKLDSGTGFALTPASFIARQMDRFYDIVTFVCDFFGISLIPGNHQIIKGGLLLMCITLLIVPFFMQRQKLLLAFLILSIAILDWPSLLIVHHPRYIYVGLPFFIFMFGYALTFYIKRFPSIKKIILFGVYALLIPLFAAHINNQYSTATSLNIFSSAVKKLAHEPSLGSNPIYLVGLPMPWSGIGIEQGLQLYNPQLHNKVIPCRETYKEKINFLTETDHENVSFTPEQLNKNAPLNEPVSFISWDFQKQCFYQIIWN